jgi:hypothetical protein
MRNRNGVFVGKGERSNNFVVLELRGRIMLSWMFQSWGVILWVIFMWCAMSVAALFWNWRLNKQSEWE